MSKHTKGEWAWQKFGQYYNLTAQHGMREIIIGALADEQSIYIGKVAMNKDGRLQAIDPSHPNAKLIAASPDLLEASINMVSSIENWLATGIAADENESKKLYLGLKAAIQKATQ